MVNQAFLREKTMVPINPRVLRTWKIEPVPPADESRPASRPSSGSTVHIVYYAYLCGSAKSKHLRENIEMKARYLVFLWHVRVNHYDASSLFIHLSISRYIYKLIKQCEYVVSDCFT